MISKNYEKLLLGDFYNYFIKLRQNIIWCDIDIR